MLLLQVFALGFVSVFDQVLDGMPGKMAAGKEKVCTCAPAGSCQTSCMCCCMHGACPVRL